MIESKEGMAAGESCNAWVNCYYHSSNQVNKIIK